MTAVPRSSSQHLNKTFLQKKDLQTNLDAVLNVERPVNNNRVAVVITAVVVAINNAKCMTQPAPPVVRRHKFLSAQVVIALFSVGNASDKIITDVNTKESVSVSDTLSFVLHLLRNSYYTPIRI